MNRLRWIGFSTLVVLSLMIAMTIFIYLFGITEAIPDFILPNYELRPIGFAVHTSMSALALVGGLFQFLPVTRRTRWHRWMGRVYVIACILGGLSGLYIAQTTTSGIIAQIGFSILALLWLAITIAAYWYARSRNFVQHRKFMYRSYGLTAAGISLRLVLVLGLMTGFDPDATYIFASWACWLISLPFAEWLRIRADAAGRGLHVSGLAG